MISIQREYVEKRMQQKWYDFVVAEEQGASLQALEQLYNSYILAVEEYNRCTSLAQAVLVKNKSVIPVASDTCRSGYKKKAS